jgi:hypothetical protein
MRNVTIVATLDRDVTRAALEAVSVSASWLEVRADLAGEIDVARPTASSSSPCAAGAKGARATRATASGAPA